MNFLDFIFPEKCLYCKRYGKYICDKCYKKIDKRYFFKLIKNDYYDYMICSSSYKDDIKLKMHNFKFHEQAYLYNFFIEFSLKNKSIYNFLKNFDLITYIPMNYNKKIKRGYNQSELLSHKLGELLNIKVLNCLEKKCENLVQSALSEKERANNVKDIFSFKKNINIINKNIILVDDILTTGMTVKYASKVLKDQKCNKICVFTIAKTVRYYQDK